MTVRFVFCAGVENGRLSVPNTVTKDGDGGTKELKPCRSRARKRQCAS